MRYISIVLIFLVFGCKSAEFPDSIKTELSNEHFRIKGTKLFVKNIDGFVYTQDVNILRYSNSVYIHCLYTPGNFQQEFINQKFDFYHNKNYQIVFKKKFKLNGDDGVYYKLKEGAAYWLYFIFGDSLAENRIVATYPENMSFEKSIFNFVESIYYKKDLEINPAESAQFEFDPLNSGFQFYSFSMNSYVFVQTPTSKNERPNNLFFSQMPSIKDTIQLKHTLEVVIDNFEKNGMNLKDVSISSNYTVDSNFAYIATVKGDFEGKPFYNRLTVTSNSRISILYGGTLYNNIEQNQPIIDSLIKTVKIKN